MPRGDLVYQGQLNHGMRKRYGMPPSHNCVWVESRISNSELEERWEKAFGKHRIEEKEKCTCNLHEVVENEKTYLVKEKCNLHPGEYKRAIKLTKKVAGFSKSQKKKAKDFVMYGKGNIREVMNRI